MNKRKPISDKWIERRLAWLNREIAGYPKGSTLEEQTERRSLRELQRVREAVRTFRACSRGVDVGTLSAWRWNEIERELYRAVLPEGDKPPVSK